MSNTGADLIASALAQLRVKHVFGIISIHNLPIVDAIARLRKTRFIAVRHELAGAHSADGYARATGELGVVLASTGPGTANTVSGLYEAQYASSRVLLITTQAETRYYGKGIAYVHEAENQIPMLASVCRRVESPRHAIQIEAALQSVVNDIFTGRPEPGAIELPLDLQTATVSSGTFSYPSAPALSAPADQIEQVIKRIQGTSKRLVIAGGGVIAANTAGPFQSLVEALDCPVITTEAGRGSLPEDHPLCIGNYYASGKLHGTIQDTELTLAIGTKFAVGIAGQLEAMKPPGELVQIDIDGSMIGRTHAVSLGINADARETLTAINAGLHQIPPNDPDYNQRVFEGAAALKSSMRKRLGPDYAQIMDIIRERLPANCNFVRDQTVSAYNWANQQFPILEPRTSIHPASGALGPGLPMGIGAAIGTNKKTIIIHGDGGMMFHATELATAAQYNAPIIVCVFNDSGYGVLRWMQHQQFGQVNDANLGKVAFAEMAKSVGVPATRVRSVDEFEVILEAAMEANGPYLIDVDMEYFAPMQSMTLLPDDFNEVDIKSS